MSAATVSQNGIVFCDRWPGPDVRGARLVILPTEVVEAVSRVGGERAVRKAISRARTASGGLVAAPAEPDGPFDRRGADVVLVTLPPESGGAAAVALAAGVRAAGRPVMALVLAADTDPDALLAARDVGATGVVIQTGNDEADRSLAERLTASEEHRRASAPRFSVVVCNYNGAAYLERCLSSLADLEYPDWEVVVCDDGSTDDSVAVARRFPVRLIGLEHGGLSLARNAGMRAATGDVVAYLDSDAEAEPLWLERLWRVMDRMGADGVGGPNLPFTASGWQERVVSGAPGVAVPVCAPDGTATHLAGCNMAFRRAVMLDIDGFDARFRGSYDDVEFCSRLVDSGGRLVFAPTATVRHHRRSTIAGFLAQQRAYGRSSLDAADGDLLPRPQRPLVEQLDPRRPRYVFFGPQGSQRFVLDTQPLHVGLPLKLLLLSWVTAASGTAPARRIGRGGRWAALFGLGQVLGLAVMVRRVPAFDPRPGLLGLPQRLATASLWLSQPIARAIGARRVGLVMRRLVRRRRP